MRHKVAYAVVDNENGRQHQCDHTERGEAKIEYSTNAKGHADQIVDHHEDGVGSVEGAKVDTDEHDHEHYATNDGAQVELFKILWAIR